MGQSRGRWTECWIDNGRRHGRNSVIPPCRNATDPPACQASCDGSLDLSPARESSRSRSANVRTFAPTSTSDKLDVSMIGSRRASACPRRYAAQLFILGLASSGWSRRVRRRCRVAESQSSRTVSQRAIRTRSTSSAMHEGVVCPSSTASVSDAAANFSIQARVALACHDTPAASIARNSS
jgi:hypothetical protein